MFLNYCVVFVWMCGTYYASGRKYDLQVEAQKLYGEDFESVLKRFRKTPEYLSILKEKLEASTANMDIIFTDLSDYYDGKIKERVVQELNGSAPTDIASRRSNILRSDLRTPRRRVNEHNITAVNKLDEYWIKNTKIDPKINNRLVDIGFESAGLMIHDFIKAMSMGEELSSTLLPYPDDDKRTTHDHQVTHGTPTQSAHEYPTSPHDTYRNYRPHSLQ